MQKLKELSITSLSQFTARIEKLLSVTMPGHANSTFKGNWYRGAGEANYSLTPTLFRHPVSQDIESLLTLERSMLDDFARQSAMQAHAGVYGEDDLKSLFYMQHYGIPTRLLDWTTNPFIALFFALTSAKQSSTGSSYISDAAVWVVDPVQWNQVTLSGLNYGDKGPLSQSSSILNLNYGPRQVYNGKLASDATDAMIDPPVAILGIANNARMIAQRGVFTMFGRNIVPMDQQFELGKYTKNSLTKLVVDKSFIGALLEQLIAIGYSDSIAYPDMGGIAAEIKRLRGFRL